MGLSAQEASTEVGFRPWSDSSFVPFNSPVLLVCQLYPPSIFLGKRRIEDLSDLRLQRSAIVFRPGLADEFPAPQVPWLCLLLTMASLPSI